MVLQLRKAIPEAVVERSGLLQIDPVALIAFLAKAQQVSDIKTQSLGLSLSLMYYALSRSPKP